ncbi:MAG: hypothetical protein SNG14_01625 [Rikenellaceae bacterium]
MKKSLYTTLLVLAAFVTIGCVTKSTTSKWTNQQRKEMRRALHQYRDMVYLDEMTDAEFIIFANNVTDEIEAVHPLYTTFTAFPAVSDSIDMYVTTTIVEQLQADGSNMRHIYPYSELRRNGVLPSGLTRPQKRAFYKCLARKINAKYNDFEQFFQAVVANTTDTSAIAEMQQSCAKELFDYEKK